MNIQFHLDKASAFDASLAKLDPLQDSALYVVYLMRAGTNRVNAALHALGATVDAFPIPAGPIGDLNHTYKPVLAVPVPEKMREPFRDLAFLENLRPDYVRGARTLDSNTAAACAAAYKRIRTATGHILEQRGRA